MSNTSTVRVPLSKRERFEILKRDGFRCRYCGATPDQRLLHIDHVIPVKDGGTNDAANLVVACQPCNAGKSSIPLDSPMAASVVLPTPAELKEQRQQIKAYLDEQKLMENAYVEAAETFYELWVESVGPMSEDMFDRVKKLVRREHHKHLIEALRIVGGSKLACPGGEFYHVRATRQAKYFSAVLRNIRDGIEWRRY